MSNARQNCEHLSSRHLMALTAAGLFIAFALGGGFLFLSTLSDQDSVSHCAFAVIGVVLMLAGGPILFESRRLRELQTKPKGENR